MRLSPFPARLTSETRFNRVLRLCHRFGFLVIIGFVIASEGIAAESIRQELQSGPVSVALELEPKSSVIGDTVTLTIEVVAEEGVEVLMPDFGDALDRFTIVDFAPRETIDDQGRTIAKQTYRLDPPSSGKHVVPPILVEYVDRRPGMQSAPDGLDAYEVLTDRIPFEVASVLPDADAKNLKPPLGELAPLEPAAPARWPIWVAIGVLLLAIIPFIVRAIMAARRRQRRRSAYDVATSRLGKLLRCPRRTEEEIVRFFVGLSFIIRQYIEDRFEMRAPELTTEEFLASIGQSPDFSSEHQGLLREFLKQADLVKFARAKPSDDEIQRSIEHVRRFLEDTRENAPLVIDDDDGGESDSPSDNTLGKRIGQAQPEEAAHE